MKVAFKIPDEPNDRQRLLDVEEKLRKHIEHTQALDHALAQEAARTLALEAIVNVSLKQQPVNVEEVRAVIAMRSANVLSRYGMGPHSQICEMALNFLDGMMAQNEGWRLD